MQILDPGHRYHADCYDGTMVHPVIFMKREGENYPGNEGHHPGTNCQELIRILINRIKYLDEQKHHENNIATINHLQYSLWLLEDRAAEQHGIPPHDFDFRPDGIEEESTCNICGHIICKGHANAATR